MDTIQKGGNYGWDFYEGNCYSCGYINPAYAYGHNPVDAAASAMAAYAGHVFPSNTPIPSSSVTTFGATLKRCVRSHLHHRDLTDSLRQQRRRSPISGRSGRATSTTCHL